MRPASIVTFERLFLTSTALGAVNTVLLSSQLSVAGRPLSRPAFAVTVVIAAAVAIGLMLLLWWFVARRGSVVAKWLAVAVAAYTLLSLVYDAAEGVLMRGALGVSIVAAGVMQIVAVLCLFRPDARGWFDHRPEFVA